MVFFSSLHFRKLTKIQKEQRSYNVFQYFYKSSILTMTFMNRAQFNYKAPLLVVYICSLFLQYHGLCFDKYVASSYQIQRSFNRSSGSSLERN